MEDTSFQLVARALQAEWGLSLSATISEEEIIKLLAEKLVPVIQKGPDAFYQLMYRLDISEKKLMSILHEKDVAEKVARLIYDRQLQKIVSRNEHKKKSSEDDPELKW